MADDDDDDDNDDGDDDDDDDEQMRKMHCSTGPGPPSPILEFAPLMQKYVISLQVQARRCS